MKQKYSSNTYIYSDIQEMCRIVWNPKVHCSVHKISTSGNILGHTNTITVVYFDISSSWGVLKQRVSETAFTSAIRY
jgi:hypothetical protein